MKKFFAISLLFCSLPCIGQAWSGILNPVGSGTCTGTYTEIACGIVWSGAGIPGGVPSASWTQSGSTITATGSDQTSAIQTALNSCGGTSGSGKYVNLASGTFTIDGTLNLGVGFSGNYCELRGSGANQTILNVGGTSGPPISIGSQNGVIGSSPVTITAGASAGSTSLTLSSTSGITANTSYLVIGALNDPSYVSNTGDFGFCNSCYLVYNWSGISPSVNPCISPQNCGAQRSRGQIVAVTNVSGSVVTISPALYSNYNETLPNWAATTDYSYYSFITNGGHFYLQTSNNTSSPYFCTSGGSAPAFPTNGTTVNDSSCAWLDMGTGTTAMPQAVAFTPQGVYVGVQALQVKSNDTRTSGNIASEWMQECAFCWVKGITNNYADGDHVEVAQDYGSEVRDSYFSNSYLHSPGTYDSNVNVKEASSQNKVENNIFERLHTSLMTEWGAAGNVLGYNYSVGDFDTSSYNFMISDFDEHGAHTQFNLLEGNIMAGMNLDSGWGSNSNNTTFRNWFLGTTLICLPISGRGTVNCSPGWPTAGAGYYLYQEANALLYGFLTTGANAVGDVAGSPAQATLCLDGSNPGATCGTGGVGAAMPLIDTVIGQIPGSGCPPGAQCGTNSKPYGSQATGWAWGYAHSSDGGGGTWDSAIPYSTRLFHGEYSQNGALYWSGSLTHTLPASWYLASKPSWFGSVPYPTIGPDVTGGIGPGGHAYANPAQVCYNNLGGTNGSGSPLTNFNAATCYSSVTTYPLTITKTGNGTGTLGGTTAGNYAAGTTITVTESWGAGNVFTQWGGSCSGMGTCSFSMPAGPATVTANFVATTAQYLNLDTLTPASIPPPVTSNPGWNINNLPADTGGVNTPASVNQTRGNSSPAGAPSGLSMLDTMTTIPTSTQTNALYWYFGAGNDGATNFIADHWIYVGNIAAANNIEMDKDQYNLTQNRLYSCGGQWNKATGCWQYANNSSGWQPTTACPAFTGNSWHHVITTCHRINGDTSCSGVACVYYDQITQDGTTYNINAMLPSEVLPVDYPSALIDQFQIDAGPTSGTAATVFYNVDEVNFSAYGATPSGASPSLLLLSQ